MVSLQEIESRLKGWIESVLKTHTDYKPDMPFDLKFVAACIWEYVENDYAQLKELADKLENGEHRELPCKAGTPVWFIYDCGGRGGEKIVMSEGIVRSVTFDETTVWLYSVYNDGLTYHHTADEIGDRLFFNQEQAKQKLKELKEKV